MGNHPLLDQCFAVAVGKLHGSGEGGHTAVIDDADPAAIPAQVSKALVQGRKLCKFRLIIDGGVFPHAPGLRRLAADDAVVDDHVGEANSH